MSRTYFLTGALGCIGAWIVKVLLERGDHPVVYDLGEKGGGDEEHRLRALLDTEQLARVKRVSGDVTDCDAVRAALEDCGARHVVHLAGLQVPTCRANPVLGAEVNVVGTVAVLEAARAAGVERVVYASSAAVYGSGEVGKPVREVDSVPPGTQYGIFKLANEGNARVFYQDHGLSSVGLRPLTVYGVGRDRGMTSDPTRALKAALIGQEFTLRFSGPTDFVYTEDVARAFLAAADRAPEGAHVLNVHGETANVEQFVALADRVLPEASRGLLRIDGPPLPIAPELCGKAFQELLGEFSFTSLEDGIRLTVEGFQQMLAQDRLYTWDLEN